MNYRHAFHAGGFADVIKHIVLVRILTYLHDKPAAFRVRALHAPQSSVFSCCERKAYRRFSSRKRLRLTMS